MKSSRGKAFGAPAVVVARGAVPAGVTVVVVPLGTARASRFAPPCGATAASTASALGASALGASALRATALGATALGGGMFSSATLGFGDVAAVSVVAALAALAALGVAATGRPSAVAT